MDGPIGILSYRDAILHFCDTHEEKPSFLDFENNWLRTDGRTDRPTDRRTDGRTDPVIEMRGRI